MPREIRFAAFARAITSNQSVISYNALVPKVKTDANGEVLPYRPPKLKLRPLDVYRVVAPYASVRFIEQAKAVKKPMEKATAAKKAAGPKKAPAKKVPAKKVPAAKAKTRAKTKTKAKVRKVE